MRTATYLEVSVVYLKRKINLRRKERLKKLRERRMKREKGKLKKMLNRKKEMKREIEHTMKTLILKM
jgi:hypothetical protein